MVRKNKEKFKYGKFYMHLNNFINKEAFYIHKFIPLSQLSEKSIKKISECF